MLLNPFLFNLGNQPAILDNHSVGLWSTFGLFRLLSNYTGPIIRVRRSSDNAQMDIGALRTNELDTVSLNSFVGGASAFIVRAYDQTGNLNDWVAPVESAQPRIINGGVYLNKIEFDGATQTLRTTNPAPATFDLTFAVRHAIRRFDSFNTLISQWLGINGATAVGIQYQSNNDAWTAYQFENNNAFNTQNWPKLGLNTFSTEVLRFKGNDATPFFLARNGTVLANSQRLGTGTSGGPLTSNNNNRVNIAGLWNDSNNQLVQPTALDLRWAGVWVGQPNILQTTLPQVTDIASSVPIVTPAIFDNVAANLWSAAGLGRLLSTYTGPIIRVRRQSDNSELDIGALPNNTLDTAALTNFVGSGDAYLVQAYDQTGGGQHWVAPSQAAQTLIVSAGVFLNHMFFDQVNDILRTVNPLPATLQATLSLRYALRSVSAPANVILSQRLAVSGTKSIGIQYETGNSGLVFYDFQNTNQWVQSIYPGPALSQFVTDVGIYRSDSSTKFFYYRNGTAQPVSNGGNSVSQTSLTSNQNNRFDLGASWNSNTSTAEYPAAINVRWMAIWTTAINAGDAFGQQVLNSGDIGA